MRGVMRAGVNATRFGVIVAEITGGCLQTSASNFPSGMIGIIEFDREWMQVDISVGAVIRTETAPNAPILDDDFE